MVMQHKSSENLEITLTEAAKKHLISYLSQNSENIGVRFSVKKTGCSGWSYVVDYIKEITEEDSVTSLTNDFLLCIDRASYRFLKNMQVDYVKQGLNSKFVFTNPNQIGQCGCGESFTVDDNS